MGKVQQTIKNAKKKGMSNTEIAYMRALAKKTAEEEFLKYEEKAAKQAFIRLMSITASILAEDYWKKSAAKRLPQYFRDCGSLFESVVYQNVTMDELIDSLKEYGIDEATLTAYFEQGRERSRNEQS